MNFGFTHRRQRGATFKLYPFKLNTNTTPNILEASISGFCTKNINQVVLAVVNYSPVAGDEGIKFTYKAFLAKGLVFCIDDTGSMEYNINYAKAAAVQVLNDNAKAGKKFSYTLLSFKDGDATLRGQSTDEATMEGYINALYAYGGAGCPESSQLAMRQASAISPNSEIYMMTDASSNSYGVDNTYADAGEIALTETTLLNNNCHANPIVYGDCTSDYYSSLRGAELQCPGCRNNDQRLSLASDDNISGVPGYNSVANSTGGLFFRVQEDSADTTNAAEIVMNMASTDSSICVYDGSLSGGNTVYNIPVDSTITQLQVVLNGYSGSSLNLTVKNPSGTVVNSSTSGVSTISVGGSTFYLIQGSALSSGGTGVWTATASGSGSYRFNASCSTTNPMSYTGNTYVGVGDTLSLAANVKSSVSGIQFLLVNLDGSNPVSLSLTSSDGLSYTGSRVMNSVGTYRFRATGSGNYQRMYSSPISVGNVDVIAPQAENVPAGSSLTYQFEIKNLGAVNDTYNIYAHSSMGWANLTSVPSSEAIPAGGSVNIGIPVTVPSSAVAGQIDVLSVQAVSQTSSLISASDQTRTLVGIVYDLNGDGVVDVVDIMMVASRWNSKTGDSTYDSLCDLNGDGVIDISDIMMVAAQWGWHD